MVDKENVLVVDEIKEVTITRQHTLVKLNFQLERGKTLSGLELMIHGSGEWIKDANLVSDNIEEVRLTVKDGSYQTLRESVYASVLKHVPKRFREGLNRSVCQLVELPFALGRSVVLESNRATHFDVVVKMKPNPQLYRNVALRVHYVPPTVGRL